MPLHLVSDLMCLIYIAEIEAALNFVVFFR